MSLCPFVGSGVSISIVHASTSSPCLDLTSIFSTILHDLRVPTCLFVSSRLNNFCMYIFLRGLQWASILHGFVGMREVFSFSFCFSEFRITWKTRSLPLSHLLPMQPPTLSPSRSLSSTHHAINAADAK